MVPSDDLGEYHLPGGGLEGIDHFDRKFFTDPSNASVTGLMDLTRRAWSPEILDAGGLSETELPLLVPATSRVGAVSEEAVSRESREATAASGVERTTADGGTVVDGGQE